MNANRFALPVVVCIGLALIPTLLHSYADLKADDGYTATAINTQLAGLSSRSSGRRAGWAKKTFDSDDWLERYYSKRNGGDVLVFVARSYDLKRLYHHPELAVAYGTDLREEGTSRLAGMKDVPVHVLRGQAREGAELAVYALLQADEFVDNPYLFQLRTAWELLSSARRPMTLFFVLDRAADPGTSLAEAPATHVLFDAIRSFRAQARSGSR